MAASSPTEFDAPDGDDLSALSWVQDELRRALEVANKALRRYLKEAESASDLDSVDPSVLRQARNQLHQSVGVLELVGLAAPAAVLRAAEAALHKLSAKPRLITLQSVHTVEHGSFAVLEFIDRKLAGKPVAPLALFPQYRGLQELAGASRIHPADLWPVPWSWRSLPPDHSALPQPPDAVAVGQIETDLLALMRGASPATAARMSDRFAGLGADASGRLATLWQLAAAFFEAQADRRLSLDAYSKRVGSRLLSQLRAAPCAEPSERLAHDLLFFCSQALGPVGGPVGPRLAAVRAIWGLTAETAVDLEVPRLGRFDPAWVAQARKRVAAAKELWSAVAGGDLERQPLLAEQFALVTDSLQRLYPDGGVLGRALQTAVAQAVASGQEPPAPLAMEVATALLYLDASVEDGDFDHPDTGQRVNELAQRIEQVRQGRDPGTLALWMEELYRRVSDRQTLGSVVQELRAALSEVEKHIDQYFRNPAERALLIPVPGQLSAMRGVLSVLGLDQASAAVLRMRDDVDALANTEVDPQRAIAAGTFDRLADNLGALSFLIDMVSVQPQMAKSMFSFDADRGLLSAHIARADRPTGFDALDGGAGPAGRATPDTDAQAVTLEFDRLLQQSSAAQRGQAAAAAAAAPVGLHGLPMLGSGWEPTTTAPSPADAVTVRLGVGLRPDQVTQRMSLLDAMAPTEQLPALDIADATMRLPLRAEDEATMRLALSDDAPTLHLPPLAEPPATQPSPSAGQALDLDAEMREVFLEEAREVIDSARAALEVLAQRHDDAAAMTTVRRAFHTLKGSGRMVGLTDFGEAAWACEQLYNARLSDPAGADHDLRAFSLDACQHFSRWVDAIEAGTDQGMDPVHVSHAADALRNERRLLPIGPPPAAAPAELPFADMDLVLDAGEDEPTAPGVFQHQPAEAVAPPLQLRVPDLPSAADLDLGAFDAGSDLLLPDLGAAPAPAPSLEAELLPVAEATDAALLPDLDLTAFDELQAAEPMAAAEPVAHLAAEVPAWASVPEPDRAPTEAVSEPTAVDLPLAPAEPAEAYKQIGHLRIGIPLFNIFLNEADELSRRLGVALAEWAIELHRPVGEATVALAHSLAGNAATVGYDELSHLARALEHALERSQARGHGTAEEADHYTRSSDEIRRLLHLFAAGFLNAADPALLQALHDIVHAAPDLDSAPQPLDALAPAEPDPALPDLVLDGPVADTGMMGLGRTELRPLGELPSSWQAMPAVATARHDGGAQFDDEIDQQDMVDPELFSLFCEEANELLPQLQARLRDWSRVPADAQAAAACMRPLHTLKGSARLAGAMRLGEMAHRLESGVERLAAHPLPASADVDALLARADALEAHFEALRGGGLPAHAGQDQTLAEPPATAPWPVELPPETLAPAWDGVSPASSPAASPQLVSPTETNWQPPAGNLPLASPPPLAIDWQRFGSAPLVTAAEQAAMPVLSPAAAGGQVRVRAPLLDRLVNQAGEVSLSRNRIDGDVRQMKAALGDLNDNLERLRAQLRDIELQAETQIATRLEAARASAQGFDPLEMDRFTRFQELTRMMAESVADVATVQRGLQRSVQSAEDALAHQGRMARDMQDDLMRTRLVEFDVLSERLYRVVRQAAKETGKAVRLDILGGSIEVDRGVLDRMTPSFEHLLRNSVVHGIEQAWQRQNAGKDSAGTITLSVQQIGNEVAVEVRDDGAGLDLPRIRERAVSLGLIAWDSWPSDSELANLVFQPGFSTADQVTDLAGRGVGMDVVRTEVNAMGGRIETASAPGLGASFRLVLPLTTAVTQVLMLRCGERTVAVPATLVDLVLNTTADSLAWAHTQGRFTQDGQDLPLFWLDGLLQGSARSGATGAAAVVLVRSAAQRIALQVDEVLGNQEVVIKPLGPQLSRLPGLVGLTLLPSGLPALIYNPVALATVYGEAARSRLRDAQAGADLDGQQVAQPAAQPLAPLVLVVDDSLTVRRVTQRLLHREGYRVTVAKDGVDGLDKLAGELPAVVLTDIEMPRMDGFELVRQLKADPRLAPLPVVMITSRLAQKHRDVAAELGVQHYLGKPYDEEELLKLVKQYAHALAVE